jgi:DNA invertase Pin-like site-specific DNA recombinase
MGNENLIPAARYLRMSTDRQQYSFLNQAELIAKFAERHGFYVTKTYEDPAKSGLSFRKRVGLQMLIKDVVSGLASYKAILVYDVSRWGRFQDIDEAAHYEFLCKAAGIPVHYCAEPFSNDLGLPNLIMKSLKRVMAGEYSRELGVRIFAAQKRLAALGYRQGGQAGYGLRRLLVSPDGKPKQSLAKGERKSIADDRVVQIPGPADEIACVHEIYRLFLEGETSFTAIARELDRREIRYPNRTTWNPWAVKNILTHPKYVGLNVYGRSSMRLNAPKSELPRSEWTICSGAFPPIIDPSKYEQVQNVIASYTRNRTNNHLLEDLKSILAKEGKLNSYSIRAHRGAASLTTYVSRFGSISHAIRQAGYQCRLTEEALQKDRNIQAIRAKLMDDIVLASAGRVRIDDRKNYRFRTCLRLKSTRQLVAVAVARCYKGYKGSDRWRIRCLRNERNLMILLARVNETNDCISELNVIPPLRKGNQVSVHKNDPRFASVIRLTDLRHFETAVKVISSKTESVNWTWYEPSDALATKQQLARIERACKNDLMRRGMNQKTLERIRKGIPVRASKLTKCMAALGELELQKKQAINM